VEQRLAGDGDGKRNGMSVDITTPTVDTSGPTLETFDWAVNQVVSIRSAARTPVSTARARNSFSTI
jgi:hypothetical protein